MLKKTEQILGLPLITISDGREIGIIRQLVVNPETGFVEFLLLNDGPWYTVPKALAYELVLGIGQNAVTMESASELTSLPETTEALKLLEMGVEVIYTRVITHGGRLIGTVDEMVIEIGTGRVIACEVLDAEKQGLGFVPHTGIRTFGRDVLVVDEGIEDLFIESLELLSEQAVNMIKPANVPVKTDASAKETIEETVVETVEGSAKEIESSEQASPVPASTVQPPADQSTVDAQVQPPVSEVVEETIQPPEEKSLPAVENSGASLFEERQKQFLIGKKIIRTIFSDAGETLAQEGDIVDLELLEKARVAGKFIELTASVEV